MALPNIFSAAVVETLQSRINALQANTQPQWGKMSVDQMLAHVNVAYEMAYEQKHQKPGAFKRFLLRTLLKPIVTSEKLYKPNSRTAPEFIIQGTRDFNAEKSRLIGYLQKTSELGSAHFEGKESLSMGKLTAIEWNNLLYKHLHHHLNQFGL
jgi:hypothetical protein